MRRVLLFQARVHLITAVKPYPKECDFYVQKGLLNSGEPVTYLYWIDVNECAGLTGLYRTQCNLHDILAFVTSIGCSTSHNKCRFAAWWAPKSLHINVTYCGRAISVLGKTRLCDHGIQTIL